MIVLALDTAGVNCSACIYDSATDSVLGIVTETIGKGHAERLMVMVAVALAQAALPLGRVERIAVTVGPGSFTGIRVGVAAARGFALALGVAAAGVTTLETLAADWQRANPGRAVAVGLDAKRGETYLQIFTVGGAPQSEAALLSLEAARAVLSDFSGTVIGSAAPLLSGGAEPGEADRYLIDSVARLGASRKPDMPRPKPLYLRGPDARPQSGFALERQGIA